MTTYDFDSRFKRNGVHEVHSYNFFRTLGCRPQSCNGTGRSVRGKNAMCRTNSVKLAVNLFFDVPLFHNILDDEIRIAQLAIISGKSNAIQNDAGFLTPRAWIEEMLKTDIVAYLAPRFCQLLRVVVDQGDRDHIGDRRGALCDANTHHSCSNNADSPHVHSCLLIR